MYSPIPMTATGALLVTAPPHRPGEEVFGVGRARPRQTPEQPAQFGYGVGQQLSLQRELDGACRF